MKWILAVLGVVALLVEAAFIRHYQREAYDARLDGLNQAARADTTRLSFIDSLAIARRQAEQLAVSLDRRTHERDARGAALTTLALRFDSLRRTTTGTVVAMAPVSPGGAARWKVEGELDAMDTAGVRVNASALVTQPRFGSPTAHWEWTLARAPIVLTVDFSCHRDTALVVVAGPRWAASNITRAAQDPRFCAPPAPRWHPLSLRPPSALWFGLAAVLGWVLHP